MPEVNRSNEAPLRVQKMLCVWCGEHLPWDGSAEHAVEVCREHDQKCEKNPMVAELSRMKGALQRLRRVDPHLDNALTKNQIDVIDWGLGLNDAPAQGDCHG